MSNTAAAPGWYPDPEHAGSQRYWDGSAWTDHRAPSGGPAVNVAIVQQPGNPAAIAALVLGIVGFLTMGIPLFIGLFLGGTLDLLAIIFGIVGLVKSQSVGRGLAPALVGLILAVLSAASAFLGAGTVW